MDVERCLQAHHQPGPVELDGQDGVGVTVVADLRTLLEVAHLEQLLGQRLKNDALNLFMCISTLVDNKKYRENFQLYPELPLVGPGHDGQERGREETLNDGDLENRGMSNKEDFLPLLSTC